MTLWLPAIRIAGEAPCTSGHAWRDFSREALAEIAAHEHNCRIATRRQFRLSQNIF
jgi:hypothetical protein